MSRALLLSFAALSLLACAATSPSPVVTPTPVAGYVTDLPVFEEFIATHPTPEQFRARYPDVTLVMPGTITSKELRLNRSRYFATLDAKGRVTGGRFQ